MIQMENQTYAPYNGGPGVIGNTADAPFENKLAAICGSATEAYGLTHSSAANYIGQASGQSYSALKSVADNGCGSASGCEQNVNDVFNQLARAGMSWQAFMGGALSNCESSNTPNYKVGHNPPLFFQTPDGGVTPAECSSRDIAETNLTGRSGTLYDELYGGKLPQYVWITPSLRNSGDGADSDLADADRWLSNIVPLITGSPAYQNGQVLVLITYDEGAAYNDYSLDENCAPTAEPAPGSKESCHIPLFVVARWATDQGASTYFTHYSVLKTVEGVFGLPCLGRAGNRTTKSLVGYFNINPASPSGGPGCGS